MMLHFRVGFCFPKVFVGVYVGLATVDAVLAVLAFCQRLPSRYMHVIPFPSACISPLFLGTKLYRQLCLLNASNFRRIKDVFNQIHTLKNKGSYNFSVSEESFEDFTTWLDSPKSVSFNDWYFLYRVFSSTLISGLAAFFLYFVLALVAACQGWPCWSGACGFIFMAVPKILFLAVFFLLLSFWVDLCHQPDDDDDEDEDEASSSHETLLEKPFNTQKKDNYRRWFPLRWGHVGSRQKVVLLVIVLLLIVTIVCALIIWIGMGKNHIDPVIVAQIYVDLISIILLVTGAALACYGLLLYLKMRKVRSERASSEISKVAGLAVVCVVCFSASSFVALFTSIPLLYWWPQRHLNDVNTPLLLILYYFVGTSAPSALVLWITRELPPVVSTCRREESTTITFVSDPAAAVAHPRSWTMETTSQYPIPRGSPI